MRGQSIRRKSFRNYILIDTGFFAWFGLSLVSLNDACVHLLAMQHAGTNCDLISAEEISQI